MQQWFEEDTPRITYRPKLVNHSFKKKLKPSKGKNMSLLKTFNVAAETTVGQNICVTGSCSVLGNWDVNSALVLTNSNVTHIRNNKTYNIWSGIVHLPSDREIFFRYFNAYVFETEIDSEAQRHVFVHSWESYHKPRSAQFIDESKMSSIECDIYGFFSSDKQQISKGFLTTESAVQFKLFDSPIHFWSSKLQKNKDMVSVKMTPIRLTNVIQSENSGDKSFNFLIDDLSSQAFDDVQADRGWPFVECVDIPGIQYFQHQNQFGTLIKKNKFHLFQTKIKNFGYFGYLFDIYLHKETSEEPPYHVGFTHILPGSMKYSNGIIMSPITSVRHKPIGELKIEYLIIKPAKDIHCNLDKIPDWDSPYTPLDIGHRGSGSTFHHIATDSSSVRENTIASLKNAASKGADFVEFDVQLTKDLVPVIYHDFEVSMAVNSKIDIFNEDIEMIQIPLKNLYFVQLQKLKIYHNKEPYNLPEDHFLNDTRSDYQPFPKLERVFKEINTNVGFNIELKWTMKLQDGSFELDNPFDMNLFVDTMLKSVFEFAESRSIVFSCFHPDVCTMLKMKQNRYPVLFLTQGITTQYPAYADPRCHTIENAVNHSVSHNFLGVNVHSEDLLRDITQIKIVKNAGLALFCWGEDNNSTEVVNKFKQLGVNAIIYDKLDKNYLMEKKKTSSSKIPGIFFVTRNPCDQEKILLFKKQSLDEDKHLRENNDREGDDNRYFMDVGKATFQNQCSSTDSLWSKDCPLVNVSELPSRKEKYDSANETLEIDVKPTISKKIKSEV